MNPPAAAGACGGAAGDCGVENRSPLSGAGSCRSDRSGSSLFGAGLPPWLENIFVNAPGLDCAGAPEPARSPSKGPALGTWEGGGGAGETGPLDPWLANIFVNAPGSD